MSEGILFGRRHDDVKPRILLVTHAPAQQSLVEMVLRLPADPVIANSLDEYASLLVEKKPYLILADYQRTAPKPYAFLAEITRAAQAARLPVVVISDCADLQAIRDVQQLGVADYLLKPCHTREVVARLQAVLNRARRLVCIGGGAGLFTLLSGLKQLPHTLLTSIVSMSDDGGSSGLLRTALGIPPPGDVRRSLVALSTAPELMDQLMQFRFHEGAYLERHNLGNLILTALTQLRGSMVEAVRAMGDILRIQGIVLPSSLNLTELVARRGHETVVRGEQQIGTDRSSRQRIAALWHEPEAAPNSDASATILYADAVIIGPGDLYTSVLANLCIPDIREALICTKAKKIYICNLMTTPAETCNYTAADHIAEVLKYLGGDHLHSIIVSNTLLSPRAVEAYARHDQHPVVLGDIESTHRVTAAQLIQADVGHETELIRHDSDKLAHAISNLL